MNELDLLKGARPHVEPMSPEARARIRSKMDERTEPVASTKPKNHRIRRRSGVLAAVALAAVLGGTAAAVIKTYVWTDDQPVAIPLDIGDQKGLSIDISDPDALVDPTTLESTVAEFAPAVRLPVSGSYDEWIDYATTYYRPNYDYETTRSSVAFQMVLTAQCQWTQQWLTATDASNDGKATEAIRILPGINAWLRGAGVIDDGYYDSIVEDMRQGNVGRVQYFENGCAFRGAWGNTVAERDAKATGDLASAIPFVRSFLDDGGKPADFDWRAGDALAHLIQWSDQHTQAGAVFPGDIFIAPTTEGGVMLISPSESGTRFCAVITDATVERGIVDPERFPPDPTSINTPFDPYPGPVACSEASWQS